LGVWDTVEEYWPSERLPELEYLPEHISYARHALALHERRGEMEPTLWMKWNIERSNVRQVWFPGAHADVGGGYDESALAESPLLWMRNEAVACQLAVKDFHGTGDPRVLHQQRTHSRMVGRLLKKFKGERPRLALSEFEKLPAQCQESYAIHKTAYDQMLNPIRPPKYRGFGDEEEEAAAAELNDIDTMTLQLALQLERKGRGVVA
jgi:hypothetical protein